MRPHACVDPRDPVPRIDRAESSIAIVTGLVCAAPGASRWHAGETPVFLHQIRNSPRNPADFTGRRSLRRRRESHGVGCN